MMLTEMLTDAPIHDPVLHNAWHVVALADCVKANQRLQVHLLGESIALWRFEDRIVACQDHCPHRGVSLSMGQIDCKGAIVCAFVYQEQGCGKYCFN